MFDHSISRIRTAYKEAKLEVVGIIACSATAGLGIIGSAAVAMTYTKNIELAEFLGIAGIAIAQSYVSASRIFEVTPQLNEEATPKTVTQIDEKTEQKKPFSLKKLIKDIHFHNTWNKFRFGSGLFILTIIAGTDILASNTPAVYWVATTIGLAPLNANFADDIVRRSKMRQETKPANNLG